MTITIAAHTIILTDIMGGDRGAGSSMAAGGVLATAYNRRPVDRTRTTIVFCGTAKR